MSPCWERWSVHTPAALSQTSAVNACGKFPAAVNENQFKSIVHFTVISFDIQKLHFFNPIDFYYLLICISSLTLSFEVTSHQQAHFISDVLLSVGTTSMVSHTRAALISNEEHSGRVNHMLM